MKRKQTTNMWWGQIVYEPLPEDQSNPGEGRTAGPIRNISHPIHVKATRKSSADSKIKNIFKRKKPGRRIRRIYDTVQGKPGPYRVVIEA